MTEEDDLFGLHNDMMHRMARALVQQLDEQILGIGASPRYQRWRDAFYAQRARYLEGAQFTVMADSDAEAVYLLTSKEITPR